jgi:hypothetical protein
MATRDHLAIIFKAADVSLCYFLSNGGDSIYGVVLLFL